MMTQCRNDRMAWLLDRMVYFIENTRQTVIDSREDDDHMSHNHQHNESPGHVCILYLCLSVCRPRTMFGW